MPRVVSDGPIEVSRVMCKSCHYELEYTPIDIIKRSVRDFDGSYTCYHEIQCPREECKARTIVKTF